MKKSSKYLLFSVLIFIIAITCLFIFKWVAREVYVSKSATLVVYGDDTITDNVTIRSYLSSTEVDLPFTEVLKCLGANVEWIDDNIAEIDYKDKKYTLNLAGVSLIEVGEKHNLILPPPCGVRKHTVLDRELILDDLTTKLAVRQMGEIFYVKIDKEKSVVSFTKKD